MQTAMLAAGQGTAKRVAECWPLLNKHSPAAPSKQSRRWSGFRCSLQGPQPPHFFSGKNTVLSSRVLRAAELALERLDMPLLVGLDLSASNLGACLLYENLRH